MVGGRSEGNELLMRAIDARAAAFDVNDIIDMALAAHLSWVSHMAATLKARVYTWGTAGKENCLGHTKVDGEGVCPYPHPVKFPGQTPPPVFVAAGENASATILADGSLWTWGGGRGGRLGHGDAESFVAPKRVETFQAPDRESEVGWEDVRVTHVAIGQSHMVAAACVDGMNVAYAWGKGSHGALGVGDAEDRMFPHIVVGGGEEGGVLEGVVKVTAGYGASGAVLADGMAYVWGWNEHGKLGLGKGVDEVWVPHELGIEGEVDELVLGTLYGGAIGEDGTAWMWGYGKYGNLGNGTRKTAWVPVPVEGTGPGGVAMRSLALTVCQINPKSTGKGVKGVVGQEGPHTLAVGRDGRGYSWGTCHKGILGNVGSKILAAPYDELVPYAIGDSLRDTDDNEPCDYLEGEEVVGAASSSIHSALLTASGKVYCFGCGSGGRMGIRAYMEGLHGARSRMKCYVSRPTAIEAFDGVRVEQIGTSRRHMIALAM